MRYAQTTLVSVESSRQEILRILRRYGATRFLQGEEPGRAVITFELCSRPIRLMVKLPDPKDERFRRTPTGRIQRNHDAATRKWEQSCRQKWRVLCLLLKAKFEAVEADAAKFDEEFLPYLLLKGGQTVGEQFVPQMEQALKDGTMPRLLLTGGPKE